MFARSGIRTRYFPIVKQARNQLPHEIYVNNR